MVPETLPPHRHISTHLIPSTRASEILALYIKNSESHPHLHPDALITPSGVKFSANGGATGGVAMHNLRRVAAGLRGEFLEPEKTPEPESETAQDTTNENGEGVGKGGKGGHSVEETANEGWVDQSEYEREEGGVEVGEIGDRTNFVQSGGAAPEVVATGGKRKAEDDREAKKRAKREREAEFKRKKAEERKKGKVEE